MTRGPDFDDLVGTDVEQAERERLRRVHDLLLEAGPPPELSPEIELGPTLAMTLSRRGGRVPGSPSCRPMGTTPSGSCGTGSRWLPAARSSLQELNAPSRCG